MELKRSRWLAVAIMVACSSAVLAQDLGLSNVKGNIAREAGISHYRLVLDGDAVTATVYKKGGDHLADCAIEFTKTSAVAECDLDASGSYRWALDKVESTVTFEDLVTGKFVIARFSTAPPKKGLIYVAPGEEPPPFDHKIEIEGNWSQGEVSQEWEQPGRLVGIIVQEVMHTLDIQLTTQGASLESEAPPLPQGIQSLCIPPDRWVCQTSLGFEGIAQLQSDAVCCSIASQVADRFCKFVTDRGCCANSLCNKFCVLNVCNCKLLGYPYDCQADPCT